MRAAIVKDIVNIMEKWAPSWAAEKWDQIGLITGHSENPVNEIWIALEITDALINEAILKKNRMILVHHPPIYTPLTNLRSDRCSNIRLIKACSNNLAIFVSHTNLDSAPGGINDILAKHLELSNIKPLLPIINQNELVKLVTFVPINYLEEVAQNLFKSGAGQIGEYQECAFYTLGEGRFLTTNKNITSTNNFNNLTTKVVEARLETILPRKKIKKTLNTLYNIHPYKEPAVDIYPIISSLNKFGTGRIGYLAKPLSLSTLATIAADKVKSTIATWCGKDLKYIKRVAIVGGSGKDMLTAAANAGAQVLITGEINYHAAEEADNLNLAIITLGHYETESTIILPWVTRLNQSLINTNILAEVKPWIPNVGPWQKVIST